MPAVRSSSSRRENSHGHVLGAVLAISILLYVLLDGFDLGVGMLFGVAARRVAAAMPC